MDYDDMTNEITKYLTYLAKRENLIKNWKICADALGVSITIHSIHDDFVRNIIDYDTPTLTIQRMLVAMVDELKVTGERNRMIRQYSAYDIELMKRQFDMYLTLNTNKTAKERADDYIEKVIFSPPATIVFFKDGKKVVVKCQYGDDWDEEKALAMAIVKHDHGLPVFNKCLEKAERRYPDIDISPMADKLANAAQTILRMFGKRETENDEA